MKTFDADKTRMIGLPYDKKNCDNMLGGCRLILEPVDCGTSRTDGRTHRQTDRIAISMSRVSVLTIKTVKIMHFL